MRVTRSAAWSAVLVAVLCLQFSETPAGSSQTHGPAPPTFRAESDLVVLHVGVSDRKRGPVSGLRKQDFIVYEDNRPQAISFFSSEETPVTVGLVVDSSSSMGPKRGRVMAAALTFAASSRPDDEIFVVNFNEHVRDALPPGMLFTNDLPTLRSALLRGAGRGRTALYDAVAHALDHLEGGRYDRRVLIVLSDGRDNASSHSFEELVTTMAMADAVVYTVGLFSRDDPDANPGVLKKLAALTGGQAFVPGDTEHVVAILTRIAHEIRTAYTIGYVPSNTSRDTRFRQLRVSVRGAGGGVRVRHREGYMLEPRSGGPR